MSMVTMAIIFKVFPVIPLVRALIDSFMESSFLKQ